MLLMMLVLPLAVVVFAAMWFAWWLTADVVSTDRSIGTVHTAPPEWVRSAAQVPVQGQHLRIAR